MTEAEEAAAAWSAGPATLIHERENAVLSLPRPLRPIAHVGLELIWS